MKKIGRDLLSSFPVGRKVSGGACGWVRAMCRLSLTLWATGLLICLFFEAAHAAPYTPLSDLGVGTIGTGAIELPADEEFSASEVSIGFGTESYLNRINPPSGISDYSQIYLGIRTRSDNRPTTGTIEIKGSFSTDVEKYTNLEVPEAYFGWESDTITETNKQTRFNIGRRKEKWSALDSDWQLGLWQPLNRFDYLRPTEQGLTGFFFGLGGERAEGIVFISPVFLPEQGAPFEIDNGRFQSRSPWFSEPADVLVVFPGAPQETTDIRYRIETPAVGSVINHISAGLLLRFGEVTGALDETGFYAQSAFIKKPRNQLAIPFSGYLQLTDTTSYADVAVYPRVVYHNLTSLDLGYRWNSGRVGFTALSDSSTNEPAPGNLTRQQLENLVLLSPSAEIRLFPRRFWGPRVKLSYLRSINGEATAVGPYGSNKGVFQPRTIFREAISLGVETLLYRKGRMRVEYGLRIIEEVSENGTIIQNDLQVQTSDVWRLSLSSDIIGSRQPPEYTQTFISRFRGNDRIFGRVTYVF